jgi:hypothetical protein
MSNNGLGSCRILRLNCTESIILTTVKPIASCWHFFHIRMYEGMLCSNGGDGCGYYCQ